MIGTMALQTPVDAEVPRKSDVGEDPPICVFDLTFGVCKSMSTAWEASLFLSN